MLNLVRKIERADRGGSDPRAPAEQEQTPASCIPADAVTADAVAADVVTADEKMADAVTAQETAAGPDPDLASDVLAGLAKPQKALSSRFLYDARGSELFEQITREPEYYPTRTEIAMLENHAQDITAGTRKDSALVEFGSGSSRKTEILLKALPDLGLYVPLDISATALDDAARRLAVNFPRLPVRPVVGDFASASVELPPEARQKPRLGFFPGSTIGNFAPEEAMALLRNFARMLGRDGRLVIGADLKKNVPMLIRAYSDANGVTAAFNLNLLVRLNRELGADFDVDAFYHLALYNSGAGRMESHLVAKKEQSVSLLGRRYHFARGERIHTESSYKYEVNEFKQLAAAAGWQGKTCWVDDNDLFSIHELSVL